VGIPCTQWEQSTETMSCVQLCPLWSEQKAALTVVSPGLFRRKNGLFSPSPGVAFPLPRHSWDAPVPTQGPCSAVGPLGPHPAAEGAWTGWSSPSHCAPAFGPTGGGWQVTLLFSQVHPHLSAVARFKEHCRIICFE